MPRTSFLALAGVALTLVALSGCGSSSSSSSSSTAATTTTPSTSNAAFIAPLGSFSTVASTVPANGDVNPYGIAFVPTTVGKLQAGQMLVSNFNAKESAKQTGQGTGTTIVQVSTTGKVTPFATIDAKSLPGPCPGGVGLTTALNILPGGYVIVGSLPTTNGMTATAKYGCLIVLNSEGKPVSTIANNNIQGPWDSTAKSEGAKTTLFVSNALNGGAAKGKKPINNSTVLRIDLESGENQAPKVTGEQVVAEGIPWVNSAEALVLGPTGVALASNGTLYVASTQDNRILTVPEAATRTTAVKGGRSSPKAATSRNRSGWCWRPTATSSRPTAATATWSKPRLRASRWRSRPRTRRPAPVRCSASPISPDGKTIYYVDDGENTVQVLRPSQARRPRASGAARKTSASKPTPKASSNTTRPR